MLFSFVILHYRAVDETKKCVESIINTQLNANYHIVIVDNNSPDNTGDQLDLLYKNVENITIIHNEKNEGFARGNNVGFKYSKYVLKADFIILQNNDTQILQKNFQELVLNEYNSSRFAVLGPYIKTPNPPFNSNPGADKIPDERKIRKRLFHHRLLLYFNYLYIDSLLLKIFQLFPSVESAPNIDITKNKKYNTTLHGSFLVFSPDYIKLFDGLNERTFLFGEEELLFMRIIKNNLKSVYLPDVVIFHQEDASTNAEFKGELKKRRFLYKCKIQSFKVMIDEIKSMHHV